MCLSTPIRVSSSREAQLCWSFCPAPPRVACTTQSCQGHKHLPPPPKHSGTSDTSPGWGEGLLSENPSHPNTGPAARACQQQWPKGQDVNAIHSKSSPVPHQAPKSNNHIPAPTTNLRLGACKDHMTYPRANTLPRSLTALSPSPHLLPPLKTLPTHQQACAPCSLREKAPLRQPALLGPDS